MQPEFWIQRWQEQQIGFHLEESNPLLVQHWQALQVEPPARIFVPLCGKSLDLVWLRDQGYDVQGVEISTLAVQDFFNEQGIPYQVERQHGMEVWQSDNLCIWCGDFFELSSSHLGQIDAVYDRAALIAMPADLRPMYVQHLLAITGQPAQFLVTLDYPQSQMAGPPFAVSNNEVLELYQTTYPELVSPHYSQDVLAGHARFAERGLTALHENVYLLQVPKK